MMGIFGMGGVGKTTLAKAMYNLSFQRFDGSCFIANIRSEVSEKRNGLVRLQEKLLCKTLNRKKFEIDNIDEGISLIKERLQAKRVLVVLDDIDHTRQLESLAGQRDWFGSGSIVIITTRNVHLLSDLRAHEKYGLETLNSVESLQLLSCHAFGVPTPLEDYRELSERIASYTGGLPLALTILGSYLHGRSVQEWRDDAEKLRRIPHDDVQSILKISYDALDDDTQSIFLDIAFFFIGEYKKDIMVILEACGFHAKIGIRTLIERCLLRINGGEENEKLQMHDLVRDMGREVVRKESPRDPGKRSRLMDPNDVFDVLRGNKGTEAIEGMIVNSNMLENVTLSTKVFSRMVNLRILKLDGVHLRGSFKYLSNELRWLRWHNCCLRRITIDSCFEKLVKLDLKDSNIEEFQPSMQNLRCLKLLKLDGCKQLRKMPDFTTGTQSLQILSFVRCSNLVEVHPSIGSLERLVELHLTLCKKLKELPNSICKLKSLEVLYLDCCSSIREFPTDLRNLEQLRELYAHGTGISHLPFSLGCLRNLKILYLGQHKGLPSLKSKSQQVEILSHFWPRNPLDPIGFFPPSIANLCSLEVLRMTNNYLHEVDLPMSLGILSSLTSLDLTGSCYLQCLPFRLCHLPKLKHLELDECRNLKALVELPPSLELLSTENCVSLENVADMSNLKRLKELYISNCKRLVELPGLENLDSIRILDITNCCALIIPPIENCFQAYSEGGNVQIWLQRFGAFVFCSIPTHLNNEFYDIIYGDFDSNTAHQLDLPRNSYAPRLAVRSKTIGDWVYKEVRHEDCQCFGNYTPDFGVQVKLEAKSSIIQMDLTSRFHFEVPINIGEVLEVYATFYPSQILCLCEMHRNRYGQVHFFPCTGGFLEFDEKTDTLYPRTECIRNNLVWSRARTRSNNLFGGSKLVLNKAQSPTPP